MNKEKKITLVKIGTIICTVLLVIVEIGPYLLMKIMQQQLTTGGLGEAASMEIIGGADGPTAIYLTTKFNPNPAIGEVILVLLIIIGCIILVRNKKR